MSYTKEWCALARGVGLTPALLSAMGEMDGALETWWHDIGAGSHIAARLFARGMISEVCRDAGRMRCNTHGLTHPGYMRLSALGELTLARVQAARDAARKAER